VTDFEELRRLAEAATPGPWESIPDYPLTGGPYVGAPGRLGVDSIMNKAPKSGWTAEDRIK
jgi:hypothetical protein